jgi:hypothetical protein
MLVIHLARKPLSEGSVAANVLKHGTGALNIDATRVDGRAPAVTGQGFKTGKYGGVIGHGDPTLSGVPRTPATGGRWPVNVILQHLPKCRCIGTRKVATGTAVQRQGGGQALFGGLAGNKNLVGARADQGFAGTDGKEEIPAWDCEPGCPVFGLDGDKGGASRFYKQVGGAGARRDPSHTPTEAEGCPLD